MEGRSVRRGGRGGRSVGGALVEGSGRRWRPGCRAVVSGAVGRAAGVGLEAVGRLWLELHWLPPLGGEELLCEAGEGGPGFYTLQAAPARQ